MKLAYGFKCDYCGKYIDWFDKISIVYERSAKDTSYKVCKTNKTVSLIAIDLCEKCARRAALRLEAKIITSRKRPFMRFSNKYKKMIGSMKR